MDETKGRGERPLLLGAVNAFQAARNASWLRPKTTIWSRVKLSNIVTRHKEPVPVVTVPISTRKARESRRASPPLRVFGLVLDARTLMSSSDCRDPIVLELC
jgi:hypothetical protein